MGRVASLSEMRRDGKLWAVKAWREAARRGAFDWSKGYGMAVVRDTVLLDEIVRPGNEDFPSDTTHILWFTP
jgi:hypothetical protein